MNSNLLSQDELDELINIRHHLHAHPELSEKEYKTAAFICDELSVYSNCKIIKNIGGTGVIAIFSGEKEGPKILFRCELDALPIQEKNDFDHKSIVENVSHKCGHDGHIAILLGLAKVLHKNPISKGEVILLFQPAEEIGVGAKAVLADKNFSNIKPDYVFALHNWPGMSKNQVMYSNNIFTASIKSVIIKLKGVISHASQPEKGTNPALAVAEIMQLSKTMSTADPDSPDMQLITPTYINMGQKAYGISAGEAEIYLTTRAWTNKKMALFQSEIENKIRAIAKENKLDIELKWTNEFAANISHPDAIKIVKHIVKQHSLDLIETKGLRGGEDFGLFTEKYRGAMFTIGSGINHPSLHSDNYDFPDDLIELGVSIFYNMATHVLE